jgi:gas vesicle protein
MSQVELTPFLSEAFASNPKLYNTIDKIYLQNCLAYYRLAKESPWYNHSILTCQSIGKEIVMKKVLGILLEGDTDKILQITKKGWKFIYNQVKSQQVVKPSEILYQMVPKTKTGQDRITNDELNSYAMVIIMLAVLLEKDLDEEDNVYLLFIKSCYERIQWADEGEYRFSLKSLTKENKRKVRELKSEIYTDAAINRYWITHAESNNEELKRFSNGLAYLFDTEGLTSSIIEDQVMSEKDIEEILAAYYVSSIDRSQTEGAKFLAAGHIIKALLRAYRQLKEQHFKTNNETLYLEIDTCQQEAKEARLEVKKQEWVITQKSQEIANLQKQVKLEYYRAVSEMRKDIKNKEIEISLLRRELAQGQSEIDELKKIAFSRGEPEVIIKPVDLREFKGIIIGGHENWHNRMKQLLPDTWRFVHPDDNIDTQAIFWADIIFFYVNYLSHAVFTKIYPEAKKNNIPIGYLKRINYQDCLEDIQRRLSQI